MALRVKSYRGPSQQPFFHIAAFNPAEQVPAWPDTAVRRTILGGLYGRHDEDIFLYAFDLIELNGDDLRPDPLEGRKARLDVILAKAEAGIRFNEHMEGDGEVVFRHACKLGFEGIVSKRLGSPSVSGRSRHWIKSKNPEAPAVRREAEEVWGKQRWRWEWGR